MTALTAPRRQLLANWLAGRRAATVGPARQSRVGPLPLSYTQERLWFLDQLGLGAAYNLCGALHLEGVLDVRALEASLTELVRRHESLRTHFEIVEGEPVQVVDEPSGFELQPLDLSASGQPMGLPEAIGLIETAAQDAFDLSQGRLLRARLIRLSERTHVLGMAVHHIVFDGWSMEVLTRELVTLYQAYSRGEASPLRELPIQYGDYALWQRAWLQGEVAASLRAYWTERLAGAPPALELPTDRARPAIPSYQGGVCAVALPPKAAERLRELAQQEQATLFMVLLAAFQVVLSRWSGQHDIIVGSPIAGRTHSQLEDLVGFFVNTLAIRTDLSGNPTFKDLLARVRESALGAYAHQDLPFDKLVADLQPPRDSSRHPIFQAALVHRNTPSLSLDLPELRGRAFTCNPLSAKFDLSAVFEESSSCLSGHLEYAADLFDAATAERLAQHLTRVLEQVAINPGIQLSDIDLLCDEERQQLLVTWNQTDAAIPEDCCLHEKVAQQAARTPHAPAIRFEGDTITYAELDRGANQLAHHLRTRGVRPEVVVGLFLERSPAMLIGLLGVLKAGGAFLALDPELPDERLAFMLDDARAPILVTQASLANRLTRSPTRVLLDADRDAIDCEPIDAPHTAVRPDNLAYVVYTSGSTGIPKGVAVPHSGPMNYLYALIQRHGAHADERFINLTSIGFDASVRDLLAPLLIGGSTTLLSPQQVGDPRAIRSLLQADNITTISSITPSYLEAIINNEFDFADKNLRTMLVSGEVLKGDLVNSSKRIFPNATIWNQYGQTETTMATTICNVTDLTAGTALVGRPISNTRVYILDDNMEPSPLGVPGELYIAGAGLARGYLGRPGVTAERFVACPWGAPGGRMYRTGDLARYLPDGNLEFLGRNDHQVKIRGFRVELGEIEARITEHPAVREAVVVARGDTTDKRLIAYLVPAQQEGDEGGPLASTLRAYLLERLPEYMVPAAYVPLGVLPLTPNGKLNREALPSPDGDAYAKAVYEPPQGEVEEALAAIWAELLAVEKVGRHDNFFELGGHSILAVRMINRLNKELGVDIPLSALFSHSQLHHVAEIVLIVALSRLAGDLPATQGVQP